MELTENRWGRVVARRLELTPKRLCTDNNELLKEGVATKTVTETAGSEPDVKRTIVTTKVTGRPQA